MSNDTSTSIDTPVVLCVEDEPLVRGVLARLLRDLGAEARFASDGREALAILASAAVRPDVVFTDLEMPEGGGEALLRAIRADPALAAIPVVALSSVTTEAPFDHCVWKPFTRREVAEALNRFWPPEPVARCG